MKPLADGRQAGTAVLVFAPVGRDAALTREFLGRASIPNLVCASMTQLCDIFEADGGGVLLLTEEALDDPVAAAAAAASLDPASLSDPALRDRGLGEAASVVARIPEVRAAMLDYQRAFARRRHSHAPHPRPPAARRGLGTCGSPALA